MEDRKVLIFGNGGSAADAQHIAAELVGRYKINRDGLPAMALTTDTSILTSLSNDFSYNDIFSRQVKVWANHDDILWGLSTSGTSENVIKAFEMGREIGTYNILFTGKNGGKLRDSKLVDTIINFDSHDTARIQEAGVLAYHMICNDVENKIYGVNL
tara:strand:- start:213 stop:683 length:471 start_codon:yes stop_codon:yes gene_type:complete